MDTYNTTPFTNITNEIFVGRYSGEDYEIEAGEVRYFPTFLSKHFAKQMVEKLFSKIISSDSKAKLDQFENEWLSKILGGEINTFSPPETKSTKDLMLEHEIAVNNIMTAKKKKQEISNLEKELEI